MKILFHSLSAILVASGTAANAYQGSSIIELIGADPSMAQSAACETTVAGARIEMESKDGKTMSVDDWYQNARTAPSASPQGIAITESGVRRIGNPPGGNVAEAGRRAVSNPGVKRTAASDGTTAGTGPSGSAGMAITEVGNSVSGTEPKLTTTKPEPKTSAAQNGQILREAQSPNSGGTDAAGVNSAERGIAINEPGVQRILSGVMASGANPSPTAIINTSRSNIKAQRVAQPTAQDSRPEAC